LTKQKWLKTNNIPLPAVSVQLIYCGLKTDELELEGFLKDSLFMYLCN